MRTTGCHVLRVVVACVVILGAATVVGRPAQAESQLEVVASGLDSPRGLAFGRHGVLYVAEAGRGGDGPCNIGPGGTEFCVGATGAVTRVRNGRQWRIISGLPSYGNRTHTFVLGPHDVGVLPNGFLHVPIGLGLEAARRAELGPEGADLGKLIRVNPTGHWRPVADLVRYELEHDPDQDIPGALVESDPYGLLQEGLRTFVVDAAGNDLLKVDSQRRISTVAVFPDLPDPESGEMLDAVPTSVARGPDGALYVGQLTGYPWPPGQAQVFRVVPGELPTVYASGFTNIIDITFDDDGRLLVLEIATNGLASDDPTTGALKRVEHDGNVTVLAQQGLISPTSVVIGPDGALYISNNGRTVGAGQVVRLQP
ncbi:MAG: ScyD/ScyE family protein [Acidimicrobiales bacterium]